MILVNVLYNNQPQANATVYLKKGAFTNPGIPFSQYDLNLVTNAYGQGVFENLVTDNYFLLVTALVPSDTLFGSVMVSVESRYPVDKFDGGPRYEKKIHIQ